MSFEGSSDTRSIESSHSRREIIANKDDRANADMKRSFVFAADDSVREIDESCSGSGVCAAYRRSTGSMPKLYVKFITDRCMTEMWTCFQILRTPP